MTQSTQDPSDVVAQHGPASRVDIQHAEKHSVRSTHPDGHEHHSEHDSVEDAHQAAATLGGVDSGSDQELPSLADVMR